MVGVVVSLMMLSLMLAGAAGVALGSGYTMTLLVPLNLFQATVISIGVAGVCILAIGMVELHKKLSNQYLVLKQMAGWDDEDDDEFEEEQEKIRIQEAVEREVSQQVKKVMQNTSCQCGSGRKFRYCCMTKQTNEENKKIIPF